MKGNNPDSRKIGRKHMFDLHIITQPLCLDGDTHLRVRHVCSDTTGSSRSSSSTQTTRGRSSRTGGSKQQQQQQPDSARAKKCGLYSERLKSEEVYNFKEKVLISSPVLKLSKELWYIEYILLGKGEI